MASGGRPKIEIVKDELAHYMELGYTREQLAEMYDVSVGTIGRIVREAGMRKADIWSRLSGPRLPDAYNMGISPEENIYDERDDGPHGHDGASKYINLGKGPKMEEINGPPARIQAELMDAMDAAEAKRVGVDTPEQPIVQGATVKSRKNKDRSKKIKAQPEKNDDDGDLSVGDGTGDRSGRRTLGRLLSSAGSTDYESSPSDYDIKEEAAEIWDQISKIAKKFEERSTHMKKSISNVNDRRAAAVDLRKEVVGQLAELSVSLSETYPFSNKDGLIEQLGAAKNTIEQSIDSILVGHNVHYDQDNL